MSLLSYLAPIILMLFLPQHVFAKNEGELFVDEIKDMATNEPLVSITNHLSKPKIIRSHFKQQKKMKILHRPMISSGSMIYAKEQGLYWSIESPFPSVLIITDSALLQKNDNNTQVITSSSQPVFFGFSQVFFQLLSGDINSLQDKFKLYFDNTSTYWRIGLLPKDKTLQKIMGSVVLQGSEYLESVKIKDKNGDITYIEFTSIDVTANKLTTVERGHFDF